MSKKKTEKKERKQKDKNLRIFRKIIKDKNTMNDFSFYDKLEVENQKKIIKELREINKITRIEKPYRMTLLESDIPVQFKSAAMKKINLLRYMEPGSGEFYKIKNWVDTFMHIPFNKYDGLPISIEDGVDKCHEFMATAQNTLDEAVYGLNDAKMQIMQMLGQLLTNPKAIGTAIAIHGPPGTGKCHTYDTPILMYDGSVKMVQDIIISDNVMGDDSTPRKVIDLGRGEDELYEIIPRKGEKFGVNSEHILCLKQSGLNRIRKINNKNKTTSYKVEYLNKLTYKLESKRINNFEEAEKYLGQKNIENDVLEISVKDLLLLPKYIYNKLKGYRTGVEFKNKPVLFDPYVLGVWLGDGTSSKPEITNQDASILYYLKHSIKKYNLNLNYYSGYTYRIAYDMYDNDSRNNKNMFLQALKDYNLLNNKHIPNEIKINDRNTRLQLLAGIIDTDGSYSTKDKCFDIIQKNKILSDDILFVARSLGYAAYQKKCNKSCLYNGNKITGEYYRICISGDNLCEIPTKCPRKKAIERQINTDAMTFGFDIKQIGVGNYYGFTLDNNHRYLLNDFTVTHNTSLVKEGISKILNRPFAFIALGGATDSSFLEGHGYTYEGSIWGKIVQILIDSKCMNPVIYFDELDKISDTPRGEEIAGILTHLTDTSQNSQFHDKYFAEINFDLSKCLFIFSYNDESKINSILKDRMYRIKTKGYISKEKTVIANNYLLPKIHEQVKFNKDEIIISDDVIKYIIDNHCNKEDGVRNLKRCLEIIYTKLNLYRLMKPGSNLFEGEMALKVEFPYKVTKEIVDKLIKKESTGLETWHSLYN
jgi:DNA polymerase III delta prime subunit